MKLRKDIIIEILTKNLGHVPTPDEVAKELNGVGLMMLRQGLEDREACEQRIHWNKRWEARDDK